MLEIKFAGYIREQLVELLADIDAGRQSSNPELEQVVQRVLIQQAEDHLSYINGPTVERKMI